MFGDVDWSPSLAGHAGAAVTGGERVGTRVADNSDTRAGSYAPAHVGSCDSIKQPLSLASGALGAALRRSIKSTSGHWRLASNCTRGDVLHSSMDEDPWFGMRSAVLFASGGSQVFPDNESLRDAAHAGAEDCDAHFLKQRLDNAQQRVPAEESARALSLAPWIHGWWRARRDQ